MQVAAFDPAAGVTVPEIELYHSQKVDRAMEIWAQREAGYVKVGITEMNGLACPSRISCHLGQTQIVGKKVQVLHLLTVLLHFMGMHLVIANAIKFSI